MSSATNHPTRPSHAVENLSIHGGPHMNHSIPLTNHPIDARHGGLDSFVDKVVNRLTNHRSFKSLLTSHPSINNNNITTNNMNQGIKSTLTPIPIIVNHATNAKKKKKEKEDAATVRHYPSVLPVAATVPTTPPPKVIPVSGHEYDSITLVTHTPTNPSDSNVVQQHHCSDRRANQKTTASSTGVAKGESRGHVGTTVVHNLASFGSQLPRPSVAFNGSLTRHQVSPVLLTKPQLTSIPAAAPSSSSLVRKLRNTSVATSSLTTARVSNGDGVLGNIHKRRSFICTVCQQYGFDDAESLLSHLTSCIKQIQVAHEKLVNSTWYRIFHRGSTLSMIGSQSIAQPGDELPYYPCPSCDISVAVDRLYGHAKLCIKAMKVNRGVVSERPIGVTHVLDDSCSGNNPDPRSKQSTHHSSSTSNSHPPLKPPARHHSSTISGVTSLSSQRNSLFNVGILTKEQLNGLEYVNQQAKRNSLAAGPALLKRFKQLGYNEPAMRRVLEYIRDEAPLIIHINLDNFRTALSDTHYRNCFELGGNCGDSYRFSVEEKHFGYAHTTPSSERVKYGCLLHTKHPHGVFSASFSHGDSFFVLRPEIRARATITSGDSFSEGLEVGNCEWFAHVLLTFPDAELKDVTEIALGHKRQTPNTHYNYKECQYHGPIRFAYDIQSLHVAHRHLTDVPKMSLIHQFCERTKVKKVIQEAQLKQHLCNPLLSHFFEPPPPPPPTDSVWECMTWA